MGIPSQICGGPVPSDVRSNFTFAGFPDMAASTDAPATSWAVPSDPFVNIKAAVTRTAYDGTDCGPAQAVDVKTAIDLYTRESFRVCGFTDLGCLSPGYRASFIRLDRDIFSIPAAEIDQVSVAAAYVNGRKVYEAEGPAAE